MKIKYSVDTSVAVKLFLDEELREHALSLFQMGKNNTVELIAPSLIYYELTNALISSGIKESDVKNVIDLFQDLESNNIITIVAPDCALLKKAVEIACLNTGGYGYISSYDAIFHALALLQKAIFLTADKKHYTKTREIVGSIQLLEDIQI